MMKEDEYMKTIKSQAMSLQQVRVLASLPFSLVTIELPVLTLP